MQISDLQQFAKVFTRERFPLYGNSLIPIVIRIWCVLSTVRSPHVPTIVCITTHSRYYFCIHYCSPTLCSRRKIFHMAFMHPIQFLLQLRTIFSFKPFLNRFRLQAIPMDAYKHQFRFSNVLSNLLIY